MNANDARALMTATDISIHIESIDDRIRAAATSSLGSNKLLNVLNEITVNKRDELSIMRHYSSQGFNVTTYRSGAIATYDLGW